MKGRYHLDTIGDDVFSTDSFELFILYLKMFNLSRYRKVMGLHIHHSLNHRTAKPADHNDYLLAIEQEKAAYDRGFVPARILDDEGYHIGWIERSTVVN
jgi:energy-converting hydrogenase Eha subunit F